MQFFTYITVISHELKIKFDKLIRTFYDITIQLLKYDEKMSTSKSLFREFLGGEKKSGGYLEDGLEVRVTEQSQGDHGCAHYRARVCLYLVRGCV